MSSYPLILESGRFRPVVNGPNRNIWYREQLLNTQRTPQLIYSWKTVPTGTDVKPSHLGPLIRKVNGIQER